MAVKLKYEMFQSDISPVYAALSRFEYTTKAYPHTHDFYELFFVLEGDLLHTLNGKEKLLQAGTACLIYPSDLHYFTVPTPSGTATLLNIAMPASLFLHIVSYLGAHTLLQAGRVYDIQSRSAPLWTVLTDNASRLLLGGARAEDVLKSIFLNLLVEYGDSAAMPQPPGWLNKALLAVRETMNPAAGPSDFLRICGKSQGYVIRQMRKYYQMTPTQYINNLRLERATSQLATTDVHILDVMYGVGFNSISNANHLFKEKYGVSPSRYRKNAKKICGDF